MKQVQHAQQVLESLATVQQQGQYRVAPFPYLHASRRLLIVVPVKLTSLQEWQPADPAKKRVKSPTIMQFLYAHEQLPINVHYLVVPPKNANP